MKEKTRKCFVMLYLRLVVVVGFGCLAAHVLVPELAEAY